MQRKQDQTYSRFIRGKFLRYSVILIVGMYLVFLLFLACSVAVVTVRGTRNKNQDFTARLETAFSQLAGEVAELAADPSIQLALRGSPAALQHSRELLYSRSNRQTIANTFVLTDWAGGIVATNLYQANQTLFQQNAEMQTARNRMLMHPDEVVVVGTEVAYAYAQQGSCTFAAYVDGGEDALSGFLFFTVKDQSIYSMMAGYNLDEITITDQFDNILLSTHQLLPDPMEKYPSGRLNLDFKNSYTASRGEKRYYVSTGTFYHDTFTVYTLSSVGYQLQMFAYGSVLLFLVGIVFVLLILAMLESATKRRMGEIDNLVEVAEHIGQGELGYRSRRQEFEEFQVLADAMNLLSGNLQKIMEDNEELGEHKRRMELKHLESQFNPHFIFNTLEALRYQIVMDPRSASDMVVKFGALVRYSVHYGSSQVSLATDIQFLGDYLALQKMRFGPRLEYTIDMEESLLERVFPKLLLQPLVENALGHGARKARHIAVAITGRIVGEEVQFCVRDSGDGMSESALRRVLERLERDVISGKHFGLYSVQRTIRLTFGTQYGVQVDSAEGSGTCVTLTMPLPERRWDDVPSTDCGG